MASLYILQSETTVRFYVGSTNELDRRLQEHARGYSLATRAHGPWKLVYREEFGDLAQARRREYEIKQWKSARMIKCLIGGPIWLNKVDGFSVYRSRQVPDTQFDHAEQEKL